MRLCFILFGLLLANATVTSALAQDEPLRPGRLRSEERSALQPGLRVEYTSLADGNHPVDVGDARLAALYVAEGQPPTPLLPPGRFRAVMTGYLKLRLRGEYDFSFAGRGGVKLSLNDQLVLAAEGNDLAEIKPVHLELVKGYNKLRIQYTSPEAGDAALRLYWASDEFPPEPIFPNMLTHDGRDPAWQAGQSIRTGRLLFAQNHCIKCHAPFGVTAEHLDDHAAMPELNRDAPSLVATAQRLNADWLANWILDPPSLRNRTTMPKLLAHLDQAEARQQAADIAAYLAGQSDDAFAPLAAGEDEEAIDRGEVLFEDRGCIACHSFSPPGEEEEDEFNRVWLHYVAAKYQPGALAAFIKDSRHYYRWSRMPKFDLTDEEASALAAYLRKRSKGELPPPAASPKPDAKRGGELFTSVGCASCHSVQADGSLTGAKNTPLAELDVTQGCLQAESKGSPRFPLEDKQREALTQFLKSSSATTSLARETPAEFSRRQYTTIGCSACHGRDDTDADLPYVLLDYGELGRPPEPVPNITWAGEKLRGDWTEQLFLGKIPYRPRPHFKIRMPSFPMRGKLLAAGMSAEHGFAPQENARPKHDKELAAVGEKVAAMHTGLACHRCHAIADKQATAPFEARSTNLSYASGRLRHGFYHRWMRDPLRIDPETKMIKFAQDGQQTGLTDFYNGQAQKQFEAVWHYLQVLNDQQRPERQPGKNEPQSR